MNNPDATFECSMLIFSYLDTFKAGTVKLGIKELFDKEQFGFKEQFPVTNLPLATWSQAPERRNAQCFLGKKSKSGHSVDFEELCGQRRPVLKMV